MRLIFDHKLRGSANASYTTACQSIAAQGDAVLQRQRLILAGGGHSHLLVLEALQKRQLVNAEIILVSDSRWQYYSGMLPGLVAGHYQLSQCRIDLQGLCQRAGCRLVEDCIVGLDAGRKQLFLASGDTLDYNILSLAVGSQVETSELTGLGDRLLTVRPFATFIERWNVLVEVATTQPHYHIAIAGAGAAGVEMALSARYRLPEDVKISLLAGDEGILSSFADSVRWRARRELKRAAVSVVCQRVRAVGSQLWLYDGQRLEVDTVITATGASAPAWLKGCGLTLDEQGFVLVDAAQRSVSSEAVFASGDVCKRIDIDNARSGVQAVQSAPVLLHNLLASLDGRPLQMFRPRQVVLYLLACGRRYAIMSFGVLSLAGGWAWRWKDRIDRRFMRRFQGGVD